MVAKLFQVLQFHDPSFQSFNLSTTLTYQPTYTVILIAVSVVTFVLVVSLLWSELGYFWNPGFRFKFTPDSDFESKLTINVDMTVAMPCDSK